MKYILFVCFFVFALTGCKSDLIEITLKTKDIKAAISGDRKLAEEYDKKIIGLHKNLFLESNPIPTKWALYKMGLIKKGIRLPLTVFSEEHHEKLLESMKLAEV